MKKIENVAEAKNFSAINVGKLNELGEYVLELGPEVKIPGKVFGGAALKATGGDVLVATNAQARKAKQLFHELEGIDIYSAAGVATASLVKAVADGRIDPEATVMLNITGAGEELFKRDKELWYLKPSHVFSLTPDADDVVAKVEALFA